MSRRSTAHQLLQGSARLERLERTDWMDSIISTSVVREHYRCLHHKLPRGKNNLSIFRCDRILHITDASTVCTQSIGAFRRVDLRIPRYRVAGSGTVRKLLVGAARRVLRDISLRSQPSLSRRLRFTPCLQMKLPHASSTIPKVGSDQQNAYSNITCRNDPVRYVSWASKEAPRQTSNQSRIEVQMRVLQN